MKWFLKQLTRVPKFKHRKFIHDLLLGNKLVICDVGATGGLEERWREISPFCHFFTFDPDPRAKCEKETTNFPIGLWSHKATKELFLTADQQASSLFRYKENLNVFLNFSGLKITGVQQIHLNSLESILKDHKSPDFLKVDAEGADFEILKGGETFLKNDCLGVQAELPFLELREGGALFSEVDTYLRSFGFMLVDLKKEYWIRKNNTYSLNTNPQLIWADAVYMLTWEEFLKRARKHENPRVLFGKWLSILMVFQMHDFAEEVRQKALAEGWIDTKTATQIKYWIQGCLSNRWMYFFRLSFWMGLASLGYLLVWPIPKWKKKALTFLKALARQMSSLLLHFSRSGSKEAAVFEHD